MMLAIVDGELKAGRPVAVMMPTRESVLRYLKRVHLDQCLQRLQKGQALVQGLSGVKPEEYDREDQLLEITHCEHRDEWDGRLPRIVNLFRAFGLPVGQASLLVNLLGELANNCFDHNVGNWPTEIVGCFLVAQRYPHLHAIEVAVADLGIGFFGSLSPVYQDVHNDLDALQKGLSGFTGRVGETRGRGLQYIKDTVFTKDHHGLFQIRSYGASANVMESHSAIATVPILRGTLAGFRLELRG